MPQGDPRPGEKYLHFKNKLYQIIALAQHADTDEKFIVYQALYGTFETYVKPYAMFVSPVDREKYPDVKQKYCFQWVEFRKAETSKVKSSEKTEQTKKQPVRPEQPRRQPVKPEPPKKQPVRPEDLRQEASRPGMSVEDKMMAFFDADTIEEKYRILLDMRDDITDRMINNMAVVLDVVIEEGPLDIRYEELKACLRTMQRYECNRLR